MKLPAVAAIFLLACTAAAQKIPDIRPGDSCEKLRASYGKESSLAGPAHVWKQDALTITVLVKPNGPCVAGSVNYSVDPGHALQTRDGVLLGRDTIADASLKLKGRIDQNSYVSLLGEGKAYGQLVTLPIPSFPFKGTYSWLLSPAITQTLKAPPIRAAFTTEPVTFYSIDPPDPQ